MTEVYMYVFDYNLCQIHCIHLDNDDLSTDTEKLLEHYGFNADECEVMYSGVELEINHIY